MRSNLLLILLDVLDLVANIWLPEAWQTGLNVVQLVVMLAIAYSSNTTIEEEEDIYVMADDVEE